MEETKNSGEPPSHRESQSFKQNYAGTFVAETKEKQNEPVGKQQKENDPEWEPLPMEFKIVLEWLRDPRNHNPVIAGCAIGALFLTAVYALFAALQWYAMLDANKTTEKALNISQAADVVIGRKDGTVGEFIIPDNPKGNAGIVLYFQNSGHLSAEFQWGTLFDQIEIIPPTKEIPRIESHHRFSRMVTSRNRITGATKGTNGGVLIGGDSLYVADLAEFPVDKIGELQRRAFLINGIFEYCDALGNHSCKEFTVFYQGIPYKQFRLATENACLPSTLEPLPKLDPNWEYICGARREDLHDLDH